MQRASVTLALLLASAAACRRAPAVSAAASTGASPTATATAEQDALWALAPSDATGGVVISPRGLELLEGAVGAAQKLLSLPELAQGRPEIEAYLRRKFGTTRLTREELGLASDQGAAVFFARGSAVAVLPVSDRVRFVQRMGGAPGDRQDRIGAIVCQPMGARYACAHDTALLAGLGRRAWLSARQAGARGDIEATGEVPDMPEFRVAVVAQLERGAITLRGAFTSDDIAAAQRLAIFAGPPVRPRLDPDHTAGFFVAYLGPLAAQAARALGSARSLEAVARTLEGPLSVTVPTGSLGFDLQQGLSDPEPMRWLVRRCPDYVAWIDPAASSRDEVCRLRFGAAAAEASVTDKTLRIRTAQAERPRVPMSRLGAELASGAWTFAGWARGVLDMQSLAGLARAGDSADVEAAVVRMYMLVNEVGGGLRVDGDAVRFVLGARTSFAYPDEVVAALLDGTADGRVREIAEAAPASQLAEDQAAGAGGLVVISRLMRVISAVAIPTFMDPQRRPPGS